METLLALEMVARHRGRRDRLRALHGPRRPPRGGPRGHRGDAQDVRRRRDAPARSSSARASATRRRCSASASRSASARPGQPEIDIAVDPLEGTNLVAMRPGQRDHRARRVREGRPAPRAGHVPREAVRRAGRRGTRRHPRSAASENLEPIAEALGRKIADLTVVILDRPRHEQLIDEIRGTGARIKLISDGDLSAAVSCAVMGTGVHAVMGIGGAPEGVLTAAALRCLGGEIQAPLPLPQRRGARSAPSGWASSCDEERVYTTNDLAPGENTRLLRDRRDRRRPAQRRPLLRRRRPHALAGDGLPG